MSTIYIGFCVLECAFVATFVRVCKKVNHFFFFFFFKSDFPPLIGYWEHWSYTQVTLCDFSSSFFPRRNTTSYTVAHQEVGYGSLFQFVNFTLSLVFSKPGTGHLQLPSPRRSHLARSPCSKPLGGGEVDIKVCLGCGFCRPASI